MYTCHTCGKTGSARQVPIVRRPYDGDIEVTRACYLCIYDGVQVEVGYYADSKVELSAEDYIQCLMTPAEIDDPPKWASGPMLPESPQR